MKKCCTCKRILSYDNFGFAKSSKDGYKSSCRECINIYSKQYWKDNKDILAPRANESHRKAYRIKMDLLPQKEIKPKKTRKEIDRDCYIKNKDKVLKRYSTPEYRIKRNTARHIHHSLKGDIKHDRTNVLLGIKISDYKEYLECMFDDKMTWENYGSFWHIDHIIPISFFYLNNIDEQKMAFNFKNTRPLSKKENLCKNNKSISNLYDIIGLNLIKTILAKNLSIER